MGVRAKRYAFGASEKPANEIQQALGMYCGDGLKQRSSPSLSPHQQARNNARVDVFNVRFAVLLGFGQSKLLELHRHGLPVAAFGQPVKTVQTAALIAPEPEPTIAASESREVVLEIDSVFVFRRAQMQAALQDGTGVGKISGTAGHGWVRKPDMTVAMEFRKRKLRSLSI